MGGAEAQPVCRPVSPDAHADPDPQSMWKHTSEAEHHCTETRRNARTDTPHFPHLCVRTPAQAHQMGARTQTASHSHTPSRFGSQWQESVFQLIGSASLLACTVS